MADHPTINLALYAQTDVGMVRSGNEDNFLILDLSSGKSWTANEEEPQELLTYAQGFYGSLLAVSDGMGGALAGEVASRMAVETVRDRMLQLQAHDVYGKMPFAERLRLSIEEANLLINGESQTNPAHKGLGATFTAVATQGTHLYFGQVGDSRAYLIRQGRISRITKDQSLVQQLIDAGQITEEEAETHSYRNVILQALGAHNNVNVEVNALPLCQLDTLVLCSDGLSGKMNQREIAEIVHEARDFKTACQQLIKLANDRGGEDNITVVIAQFSGSGLPEPDGDSIEAKSLARSPDTPTEINWSAGANTDPLDEAAASTARAHKPTEPLPPPPTQAQPFTSKLQRETARPRTNDLSDRRGPITAVFSREDFEDPAATANFAPPATTAPLDQRSTSPLSDPLQRDGTTAPMREKQEQSHPEATPSGKGSRSNLAIFIGLLVLGIAGLVVGATYWNREQNEQTQLQERLRRANQEARDGCIERLNTEITKINRKLEGTDKPATKERRPDWEERLQVLRQRLEGVKDIPLDDQQQIRQECAAIEKDLKNIEDELDRLQGLLPTPLSNREPIRV